MDVQEKRSVYYLAFRLMLGNLMLWFGAGALRQDGHPTIGVIGVGFVFALACAAYYLNKLRRLANERNN